MFRTEQNQVSELDACKIKANACRSAIVALEEKLKEQERKWDQWKYAEDVVIGEARHSSDTRAMINHVSAGVNYANSVGLGYTPSAHTWHMMATSHSRHQDVQWKKKRLYDFDYKDKSISALQEGAKLAEVIVQQTKALIESQKELLAMTDKVITMLEANELQASPPMHLSTLK